MEFHIIKSILLASSITQDYFYEGDEIELSLINGAVIDVDIIKICSNYLLVRYHSNTQVNPYFKVYYSEIDNFY